ncbi:conserved hypothetical protein [Ricinus communis]|uniref:Uncharacterized protein n=1 Tax=Ricinus communis TaxID=3988 RepID=B9RWB4_RICCO|nr:conserved hypothetical protein [Ricinus communis]
MDMDWDILLQKLTYEENVGISIAKLDIQEAVDVGRCYLVGKVLSTRSFNIEAMKHTMGAVWKVGSRMKLRTYTGTRLGDYLTTGLLSKALGLLAGRLLVGWGFYKGEKKLVNKHFPSVKNWHISYRFRRTQEEKEDLSCLSKMAPKAQYNRERGMKYNLRESSTSQKTCEKGRSDELFYTLGLLAFILEAWKACAPLSAEGCVPVPWRTVDDFKNSLTGDACEGPNNFLTFLSRNEEGLFKIVPPLFPFPPRFRPLHNERLLFLKEGPFTLFKSSNAVPNLLHPSSYGLSIESRRMFPEQTQHLLPFLLLVIYT